MLNSTFDLISLAASNSHAVFCLCNLIIVFLLVGSSKSRSEFNEDKHFSHENVVSNKGGSMERTNASCSLKTCSLINESSFVGISMVNNDEGSRDEEEGEEEEEEDDDDDELRRRAEEFIEKINKGWMNEKLKAYSLGRMDFSLHHRQDGQAKY